MPFGRELHRCNFLSLAYGRNSSYLTISFKGARVSSASPTSSNLRIDRFGSIFFNFSKHSTEENHEAVSRHTFTLQPKYLGEILRNFDKPFETGFMLQIPQLFPVYQELRIFRDFGDSEVSFSLAMKSSDEVRKLANVSLKLENFVELSRALKQFTPHIFGWNALAASNASSYEKFD